MQQPIIELFSNQTGINSGPGVVCHACETAGGPDADRRANPLIWLASRGSPDGADLHPFGQTGPYSHYKGCEIVTYATSGIMVQIPTQAGHLFRLDRGHRSDLKPATIPI